MTPAKKATKKKSKKKKTSKKKAKAAKAPAKKAAKKAPPKAPKKAAAAKQAPVKKTEEKAAAAKQAPVKKTEEKAAAARQAPVKKTPDKKARRDRDGARARKREPIPETTFSDDLRPEPLAPPKTGLGRKWACYACGAKFYDLGKPDPICPKCEADQRDAPRPTGKARIPPPRAEPEVEPEVVERPRRRALLDEDEEEVMIDDDDALDIGLGVVDEPEEDFEDDDEPEVED